MYQLPNSIKIIQRCIFFFSMSVLSTSFWTSNVSCWMKGESPGYEFLLTVTQKFFNWSGSNLAKTPVLQSNVFVRYVNILEENITDSYYNVAGHVYYTEREIHSTDIIKVLLIVSYGVHMFVCTESYYLTRLQLLRITLR